MELSVPELHTLRASLQTKIIYGHGNVDNYQKLYEKLSEELRNRGKQEVSDDKSPQLTLSFPSE